MAIDYNKLSQTSRVNYLKRSTASGQDNLPVNLASTGSLEVEHDIGKIPQYDVYADLFGDGTIWYGGFYVDALTESTAGGSSSSVMIDSWIDSTKLTIYSRDTTAGTSTDILTYFLIYLDYGS